MNHDELTAIRETVKAAVATVDMKPAPLEIRRKVAAARLPNITRGTIPFDRIADLTQAVTTNDTLWVRFKRSKKWAQAEGMKSAKADGVELEWEPELCDWHEFMVYDIKPDIGAAKVTFQAKPTKKFSYAVYQQANIIGRFYTGAAEEGSSYCYAALPMVKVAQQKLIEVNAVLELQGLSDDFKCVSVVPLIRRVMKRTTPIRRVAAGLVTAKDYEKVPAWNMVIEAIGYTAHDVIREVGEGFLHIADDYRFLRSGWCQREGRKYQGDEAGGMQIYGNQNKHSLFTWLSGPARGYLNPKAVRTQGATLGTMQELIAQMQDQVVECVYDDEIPFELGMVVINDDGELGWPVVYTKDGKPRVVSRKYRDKQGRVTETDANVRVCHVPLDMLAELKEKIPALGIVGVGLLGSSAAQMLTAAFTASGPGNELSLRVIDKGHVTERNYVQGYYSVGRSKVRECLGRIGRDGTLAETTYGLKTDVIKFPGTTQSHLGLCDIVIDALDNLPARRALWNMFTGYLPILHLGASPSGMVVAEWTLPDGQCSWSLVQAAIANQKDITEIVLKPCDLVQLQLLGPMAGELACRAILPLYDTMYGDIPPDRRLYRSFQWTLGGPIEVISELTLEV